MTGIRKLALTFGLITFFFSLACPIAAQQRTPGELRHLSLEELMNTDVTTVSRMPTTNHNIHSATLDHALRAFENPILITAGIAITTALRLTPSSKITAVLKDSQ
jgi:hypothetical protein